MRIALSVLDGPPDDTLDRIARLAARSMRVPILLVSLVDANRQWFHSSVGLTQTETSRDVSFCGHVVHERRPLTVRDARSDPRFADDPLVTGATHVRACFGIPVFLRDGQAIGTICAIDVRPRIFDAAEREILTDCAKLVEDHLRGREQTAIAQGRLQFSADNERLFRETFELAAVGITHTSLEGRLLRVNPRACEMLDTSAAELAGVRLFDITHPADVPENILLFQRMVSGEIDNYRMEKRFLKKDGSYFWVYLSVALKRDDEGRPAYMIAVIEDISRRKAIETELLRSRDRLVDEVALHTQTLREQNLALQSQIKRSLESETLQRRAEARLRAIANSMPAMIGYWNDELRNEFANDAYHDWFGLTPRQIFGMALPDLLGNALFKKNQLHVRLALEGHEQHFERTLTKADGTVSITDGRYIPDIDANGHVRGFYVLVTDITALRQAHAALETVNEKLQRDGATDYLTGIANRRVFTEQSEAAAKRFRVFEEPYGLILLDIDNFKQINDAHGHEVGDQVLCLLGRVLQQEMRNRKDVAARLGGEEFAMLCFGVLTEQSLRDLAERIRGEINSRTVQAPGGAIRLPCSFGIALSTAADADWKSIYRRADAALYEAKSTGKDCVRFGKTTAKEASGAPRTLRIVQS